MGGPVDVSARGGGQRRSLQDPCWYCCVCGSHQRKKLAWQGGGEKCCGDQLTIR